MIAAHIKKNSLLDLQFHLFFYRLIDYTSPKCFIGKAVKVELIVRELLLEN